MFGYIKPDKENLLVKEMHLYKSVYCGLCNTIKKSVSFILPATLSYDFVFLTMVRATITKEKSEVKKGHCGYNPFKRVTYCIPSQSAVFTSEVSLMLVYLKLCDDIKDKDTKFFKKILLLPLRKHFSVKVKRLLKTNSKYVELYSYVEEKIYEISSLEATEASDIDVLCEAFGDIMARVLSFSLEGGDKITAKAIGSSIGRFIYLIDAIDDVENDAKSGAFNPLIKKYGDVKAVKENVKALDASLSMYTKNAVLAFNLLDEGEYTSIINNILTLGLGKESYRIMTKNGEKND